MSLSYQQNAAVNQCLLALCSSPFGSEEFGNALQDLDRISAALVQDADVRKTIGSQSPSIWGRLHETWRILGSRSIDSLISNSLQRQWTLSVARFTRNLVAGNSSNQREAFKFEPEIRTVAHAYTSHVLILDKEELTVTRFLMQTLSNIVTSNEVLLEELWRTYLALPEEKNILLRMLGHPDDGTVAAALVLINNCVIDNRERMRILVETAIGGRLCVATLDRLSRHVESSDEDENSDMFSLGWTIFRTLFGNGFASSLLSITTMQDEIVNPHQTTLFKLLDSYLIYLSNTKDDKEKETDIDLRVRASFPQISEILLIKFFELVGNAQSSVRNSLGGSSTANTASRDNSIPNSEHPTAENVQTDALASLQSLDVLLPKVCEAIVLVAQCFCTMTLAQDTNRNVSEEARRIRHLLTDASLPNGDGLIESLIDLLRLLDAFLPRIILGKASWSTVSPDAPTPSTAIDKKEEKGFSYLKRDLVRLLGIMCYENRAVQDRVRKCDGIPVIMNLCITDERNPYLREHALFALRNLLHDNVDNQVIVDAIKPMGTWDENGVLRDVPGFESEVQLARGFETK
ncbi:uncharacterized protein FOMMEDRAFT_164457 [Fomitiporia mediterranea MF3/22]|uniref:uncharacterized protein n=1 Tax=Fomitiporia mediterranea (strain MF3/22) TaxID=694068 RepID=UPI0004408FBB|nr:uncharacterized protein FOMMEDRAFT_164457 [Fomitiporia mediterranea MF3/22]EJD07503.1 hypothetical protein FOMMEDRAFT_164457 [Fomitiporia mediterranea MF3/22]